MQLLDTNLLIRYLTNDDPAKARAVFTLLQQVQAGAEQLYTTEVVVAEATFVLSGKTYRLSSSDTATRLAAILRLRGIRLPRKRTILRALAIYGQASGLDFSDALLVATAEATGITTLLSYDTDFDGIPGITRREP